MPIYASEPATRFQALVPFVIGELGIAGAAWALAWRLHLTPAEFSQRLAAMMPDVAVMVAAQAVVLAGLLALRRDLRSLTMLFAAAVGGPLVGALWIWRRDGGGALPLTVAGTAVWLYWVLGLIWRSAWLLRTTAILRFGFNASTSDAGGLESREAFRARGQSLGAVLRYRELVRNLVIKDLKLKYRGSVLGFVWSLINPLVMTAIYALAFTYVIGIRQHAYVMYLLLGLLAWNYFVASAAMSTGSIIDSGSFVKGVYFPRVVLPLATVLFNLSQYVLTVTVFLPLMLVAYRIMPAPMMLLFPLVVALQTVFTFGVAMALSAGTARFRDVRHFLEIALQVIFWTTPIVYEAVGKAPAVQAALLLSPMAPFITLYHHLFYYQTWPDPSVWLMGVLYTSAAFLGGAALFTRSEERFAEQF